MLDVQSRRVVIGNRAAIGKPAITMLTLSAGGDGRWSAISAVTAMRRVLIESCGSNDKTPAVCQDCASARGAGVERFMSAKAVRAKSSSAAAARGAIQIKG